MNEIENQNKQQAKIFVIILGIIIFIIAWIVGLITKNNDSTPQNDNNYYVGETMSYEEIDLTVKGLKCVQNNNPNSEEYGLYYITITVTYTNNTTKEFDVQTSDVYIKTADKGEKYDCSGFSGDKGLIDALLGESIIAGATKTYDISFYTAYSLEEKKYIMCFDWGFFSEEKEYYLYLSDGTNASYEDKTESEEEINTELVQTLTNLREDIYAIFKQYVYDQITSGMYYSDVQKLVDNAERQCKSALSQLSVYLDLSNGTYYPKWIVSVTADKTYPLIYVEVELTTAYKCSHKHIGRYDIV